MIEPHDLGELLSHNRLQTPEITIARAVDQVAMERGVPAAEIRGPGARRSRRAVRARREVWRRLATPNRSVKAIANAWPCHWTTILHALGRINVEKPRIPDGA